MKDALFSAVAGGAVTMLATGFGVLVSMRIRLSVLEEKIKYLSGQNRQMLRRLKLIPAGEDTGAIELED